MSCCCSVEELCPVKESCPCNLTPWAFWVGPRPVIPLQLHPDVGLERIFGPRITTTNSMDTVDSRGPEWLPWICWALCVKLTSPACCLALTNCLLQRLNHQLSQNNGIFPDFAWDLAQAYVLLWYTHAWKPNLKRKSTSNWMPVPCKVLFMLIAVILKDNICILVSLRVWLQRARMPLSTSAPWPVRRAVPWRQALQPFLWAGMKLFLTDWSEAWIEKLERHCFTPSSCSG